MKEYVLSYYSKFKCVASDCKHTCCAGWEMCIDQTTLELYKNHNSDFSAFLDKGINYKKAKFKCQKGGRCAFLNQDGLCEIIINLGEDYLCQVCRDHPRFRSFFDDRVEMGLGFCCEQVAKIVLGCQDKITLIPTNDDNATCELSFVKKNVLEFRQRVLDILQDRKTHIQDRIKNIVSLCRSEIKEENFKKIIKTFSSFERIEKDWTKRLKAIKKSFSLTTDQAQDIICEQFLVNSVYRHLSDAEDTLWVRARTLACVYSWWIINSIEKIEKGQFADEFSAFCDIARQFSAEVEYSQKNLDKLYSACYKLINI